MNESTAVATVQAKQSIVARFADTYGIESNRMLDTLKATAFRQSRDQAISNEQMCALLIVSEKYGLNPFVREIYAFPEKNGGISPVVSVDGWNNIAHKAPDFNGAEFVYPEETIEYDGRQCFEWVECRIYIKGREKPVVVREYLDECYRKATKRQGDRGEYSIETPWQSHPKRMLRHKAFIQCARMAFGYSGIYDEDEAVRISESETARSMRDGVDISHMATVTESVSAPVPPLAAPVAPAASLSLEPTPTTEAPRRGRPKKTEAAVANPESTAESAAEPAPQPVAAPVIQPPAGALPVEDLFGE